MFLSVFVWGLSVTCCDCFSDHAPNMDTVNQGCSCLCLLWLFTRIHTRCACELNLLDCKTEMPVKHFGLLLVKIGFTARVALYKLSWMQFTCSVWSAMRSVFALTLGVAFHFRYAKIIFMTFVCTDLRNKGQNFGLDMGLRKQFLQEILRPWKFKSPSFPKREWKT